MPGEPAHRERDIFFQGAAPPSTFDRSRNTGVVIHKKNREQDTARQRGLLHRGRTLFPGHCGHGENGAAAKAFCTVIGADIDNDAVRKAEKGIYSTLSFRGLSEDLRERYFEPLPGNMYRIKDCIRDLVEFRKLNLLGDDYPSELSGTDVIFYRNVSIYFESDTQRHIFTKLAGLLNDNGYLFVSSTETLSHNIGVLSLVEIDGVFLYEKHVEICLDERRRHASTKKDPGTFFSLPVSSFPVLGKRAERQSPHCSKGAAELKEVSTSVLTGSDDRRKDGPLFFDAVLSLAKEKGTMRLWR